MLWLAVLVVAVAAWLGSSQGGLTNDRPVLYPSTFENSRVRQIPDSVLIQMKDIQNVSELLNFLGTPDGLGGSRPISLPSGGSDGTITDEENGNFTGRRKNSAAGLDVSRAAGCEVEQRTVELEKPADPTHVYWPMCIRLPRCGGCCTSDLLECVPIRTAKVEAKAVHVQYLGADLGGQFEVVGIKMFKMEKHEKCACRCRERPEHCTPLQNYMLEECRCVCSDLEARDACDGTRFIWDPRECACKCREAGQCSTGFFYNELTCRCEIHRVTKVGRMVNETLDLSELESNSSSIPTSSSSEDTTSSTTSTTTTKRPLVRIASRIAPIPRMETVRYKAEHIGIRPEDGDEYEGPFTLARSQQKNKTRRIVPSLKP